MTRRDPIVRSYLRRRRMRRIRRALPWVSSVLMIGAMVWVLLLPTASILSKGLAIAAIAATIATAWFGRPPRKIRGRGGRDAHNTD